MLRRNGKPRSCEPCRISKTKCDHSVPKCRRCEARGLTTQCFYHPNPMTKPIGTPRKKPEPRRHRLDSQSGQSSAPHTQGRLTPLAISPPSLRNDIAAIGTHNSWPTPSKSVARTIQAGSDSARNFYLGSTSYAAVFTRDHTRPDTVHEQLQEHVSATHSMPNKDLGHRRCQFRIGQSILAALTPFSLYEKAVDMYFRTHKASCMVGPLVMPALPQVRKDLEAIAADGGNVTTIYARMIKNTTLPLKVLSTMLPSQFYTLFTGENLRWETLGLILIITASYAQHTSPGDDLFTLEDGTKIEKDNLIEKLIHVTNDCINICNIHGAINDIMVWLLYTNKIVISNFYGDNYHGTWRRLGDCVTAMYAAGIHCEGESCDCDGPNREPLFIREARRRMYAVLYRSDKTLAIFLGRPPMAIWRYSDRRQLLDISDHAISSDDPNATNDEIAKLSEAGWNTEGHIHPASIIRLRCQHAVLKERLLEQSLAGDKDVDVVQNLRKISVECTEFWDNLPAHLRYEMYTEEDAWVGLGPRTTVRLIACYLDYLHLHFQIQRLLHRDLQEELPTLLEVSLKLLSTSLISTKPSNGAYETQRQVPTVILFYCFPAAGVLALELRRCTIEGVPLPETVSRADVIRNLSVLTSCLGWIIVPGDGNHKLCMELNKMLALILDEVLNYTPLAPIEDSLGGENPPNSSGQTILDLPMIEGMDPIPMQPKDFLNWLDNATWSNPTSLDLFTI